MSARNHIDRRTVAGHTDGHGGTRARVDDLFYEWDFDGDGALDHSGVQRLDPRVQSTQTRAVSWSFTRRGASCARGGGRV